MRLQLIFSVILLICASYETNAATSGEEYDDPMSSLIDLVLSQDSSQVEQDIDPDILTIISEFSSENNYNNNLNLSIERNILDYLTGFYSEHDFHESGSWVDNLSYINQYQVNENELPKYSDKDFIQPIKGRITSGFGFRQKFNRHHHGIDVALNIGDTVKSALPGVVTKVAYDFGGYGNYVVVSHRGGMETLYGHLSGSLVIPGQHVKAGDAVGLGGNTGNSTGPHLHFETRKKGVPYNPAALLRDSDVKR